MVLTFSNWWQTGTLAMVVDRKDKYTTDTSYTTTLAVLPCSKHSCRSSLSVFVVLKGLRKRKKTNWFPWPVQTQLSFSNWKQILLHPNRVYYIGKMYWYPNAACQEPNNVTTKETSFPLYIIFLTIHTPTCSCQEGYPRSSVHGGRQTPPWRRSSLGCTVAQKKNHIFV